MTAGYGARLLMLSLLVFAACTATAPAESSPPTSQAPVAQRTRMIVGYIPTILAAAYYVGLERGYFDAEGIDLESEHVAATGEALAQVAAGRLHVANVTVGAAV